MTDIAPSMTINGAAVRGPALFDIVDPATGQVFAQAPDCSDGELDTAIAAARAAFPGWAALPIGARKEKVAALGHALFAHAAELKEMLTREQGKPLAEAEGEAMGGGYWCLSMAALDIPAEVIEDGDERRVEVRRVPIGVVGAIAPWNFPIVLAMFKVAPALLAGNTVVLKPSPLTPLTTLRIGEIFADLLPPGVLNVVSGGDALGPKMTAHPGFDKISFTGSTETGRKVMRSAADTLKRVTLELGGNDPAIVLADADVDKVAPDLFWAALRNSGQICIAAKRIYVHDTIYDRLAAALVELARATKMGPGTEAGVQLGPIQNRAQYDRVRELIEDSRKSQHRFLVGGDAIESDGFFVPVTIIDNPPEDSRIVAEEQFGPVVPLMRYHDVEEAIARANASNYGLGASVWGSDLAAAQAVANRLQSGTVWINEAQYLSPGAPFAGRKQSGIGVENGLAGLLEYTAIQTVVLRK